MSKAKFSYFEIFSASVLGMLWVRSTDIISFTSAVILSVSTSTLSVLLKSNLLIGYDRKVLISNHVS